MNPWDCILIKYNKPEHNYSISGSDKHFNGNVPFLIYEANQTIANDQQINISVFFLNFVIRRSRQKSRELLQLVVASHPNKLQTFNAPCVLSPPRSGFKSGFAYQLFHRWMAS